MVKDPVLEVVKEYRLPISRNQKSIKTFLSQYFEEYRISLLKAIDTQNERVMRAEFYKMLEDSIVMIKELSGLGRDSLTLTLVLFPLPLIR